MKAEECELKTTQIGDGFWGVVMNQDFRKKLRNSKSHRFLPFFQRNKQSLKEFFEAVTSENTSYNFILKGQKYSLGWGESN